MKACQTTGKPDSVGTRLRGPRDDHLSGTAVADRLERRERPVGRAAHLAA